MGSPSSPSTTRRNRRHGASRLTFPVLAHAGLVVVAAFGASKAAAMRGALHERRRTPVARLLRRRRHRWCSWIGRRDYHRVYLSGGESHASCIADLYRCRRTDVLRRIARTHATAGAPRRPPAAPRRAGAAARGESRLGRAGYANARKRISRRRIRLPVRFADRRSAGPGRTARGASRSSGSTARW